MKMSISCSLCSQLNAREHLWESLGQRVMWLHSAVVHLTSERAQVQSPEETHIHVGVRQGGPPA